MKAMLVNLSRRLPEINRHFILWGVLPGVGAALTLGFFIVPNYIRAARMYTEAQRLHTAAEENIVQKDKLEKLEARIKELENRRRVECKALCTGLDNDRLPAAITRQNDTGGVRDQAIRSGPIAITDYPELEKRVAKRDVTVEMNASFDAIFSILDSVDTLNQLVTPKSVEIYATALPAEQAIAGNPTVFAAIIFEEWFEPSALRADVKAERPSGSTAVLPVSTHAAPAGTLSVPADGAPGAYQAPRAAEQPRTGGR